MNFNHGRYISFMNGKFIEGIRHITKKRDVGIQMNQRPFINDIGTAG